MSLTTTYGELFDPREQDALITEHLPLVRYIARHIHDRLPQHVPLEDLVHAGVIGLMDAMKKFDAGKDVQFKTYAKFRIRGAILDSLREMDWGPRDLRRKARLIDDVSARLGSTLGREPNERELAEELQMSLQEFQSLLGELGGLDLGSLQVEGENGDEHDLAQRLAGPIDDSPYVQCLRSEVKAGLAKAIRGLTEREQQVLSLYYYEELTMKDIGDVLGVGESRVSQIHSLAISRLRVQLRTQPAVSIGLVAAASSDGGAECRRY
jgi:RNA polymerase sigma factor FliA